MVSKRNIGGAAVIGGLTAAFLLLRALPAAEADELSDLRNNQQTLQQRIDRLPPGQAPAGSAPDTYAAPADSNQPLPGGSFPRSLLIPGTNTSIRVGGSIDATAEYGTSR